MKKTYKWVLSLAICLSSLTLQTACSDDETDGSAAAIQWTTKKVAVVLPMDDGLDIHWKRTLDLCANNVQRAFTGFDKGVKLEYEWYNENDSDLKQIATSLAKDTSFVAVIGGLQSDAAKTLASALYTTKKPLFTLSTAEDLVRAYASAQTVWAMTETDITQCEALLTRALYYGNTRVALIANGDTPYGKTFVDWFAFQAQELGLDVSALCDYSESTPADAFRQAYEARARCIICAPSTWDDLKEILETKKEYAKRYYSPSMLFSDAAYGSNVLEQMGDLMEGIEGVAYSADPESGFDVSYNVYFDDVTTLGEAQVYDAAMLIAYASYMQLLDPTQSFTSAMCQLVDGREACCNSWMAEDMHEVIAALNAGGHPDIQGASGSLDFDAKVYTNVLASVYCNYMVYNGQYIILDYNTSDGSNRTSQTLAGWNWKASQMQEADASAAVRSYPELKDHWALLVAGSSGWSNYRHQADVLNMYQILRSHGYTDDHIVLIEEDDIANNSHNGTPGVIQVRIDGINVYENALIDYHTSDLTPADLKDILCGVRSERLPEVIDAGPNDNVLLFWSGHGAVGEFCWLNQKEGFTTEMASATFRAMSDAGKFRKLLCLIETCYSGSVMQATEGIPGLLAITAAAPNETSKADIFNADFGVWMSNRFTSTLQDCISGNANISMRDLYYRLFLNTVGSHVMVYNADYFDNLYSSTLSEFINAQ